MLTTWKRSSGEAACTLRNTHRMMGCHTERSTTWTSNLVSLVQKVLEADHLFVFSDGHGIAAYTDWYDSIADLDKVVIRSSWYY